MSPGGLLSAGTGAWPPARPPPDRAVPVARAVPAPPTEGADDPEPPQAASVAMSPASATALPSRRDLKGCVRLDMPRFYRAADEEKMNPPDLRIRVRTVGRSARGRPEPGRIERHGHPDRLARSPAPALG